MHKYGQPIGVATRRSPPASTSTTTTSFSASRGGASSSGAPSPPAAIVGPRPRLPEPRAPADGLDHASTARTFEGLLRPDGRVGTRNYLAVASSVNCSATVVRRIGSAFSAPGALDQFPNVDGVIAVTHRGGCGLDSAGEGLAVLRRTLAGYARHPNVAGVVVIGLGCEVQPGAGTGGWFAFRRGYRCAT